jgi:hypothetical protein
MFRSVLLAERARRVLRLGKLGAGPVHGAACWRRGADRGLVGPPLFPMASSHGPGFWGFRFAISLPIS